MNVKIYLNEAEDAGRRYFSGYEKEDPLRLAIEYRDSGVYVSDVGALDNAFYLFNVGHEHLFDKVYRGPGTITGFEKTVLAYRFARNRSLSVGDVVLVGGRAYAVDGNGWTRTAELDE